MALSSTDPRPAGRQAPRMSFGPSAPNRTDADDSADGRCLAYALMMESARLARLPGSDVKSPAAETVESARKLCVLALGHRRRRVVMGRVFTVDRAGGVCVSPLATRARTLPPYLVRHWGLS